MAADQESSDDDIISPRHRRLGLGKKKGCLSDSGEDTHVNKSEKSTMRKCLERSSERIRKRQSIEFRMPDREDCWEKITTESPAKSLKNLSPRKLVNNFTKINNSYNADTYDSDEEDMSDFIVEDDEVDDEEDSSAESGIEEIKYKGRVDRIRTESVSKLHRVREISSSDSESESGLDLKTKNEQTDGLKNTETASNKSIENNKSSKLSKRIKRKTIHSSSDEDTDTCKQRQTNNSELESDSDNIPKLHSTNKKSRFISSESDSDSDGSTSDSIKQSATKRTKQRLKQRKQLFEEFKNSRKKSS